MARRHWELALVLVRSSALLQPGQEKMPMAGFLASYSVLVVRCRVVGWSDWPLVMLPLVAVGWSHRPSPCSQVFQAHALVPPLHMAPWGPNQQDRPSNRGAAHATLP